MSKNNTSTNWLKLATILIVVLTVIGGIAGTILDIIGFISIITLPLAVILTVILLVISVVVGWRVKKNNQERIELEKITNLPLWVLMLLLILILCLLWLPLAISYFSVLGITPTPTSTPTPTITPLPTMATQIPENNSQSVEVEGGNNGTIIQVQEGDVYIYPTVSSTSTLLPTLQPTTTFTPQPTATPLAGTIQNFKLPTGQDVPMAYVPGGSFWMGNDREDAPKDEIPMYPTTIPSFWMDVHEVTNEEFSWYIRETGASFYPASFLTDPNKVNHPVVHVNFGEALAYCNWRGATLPTEEQWEKAARGTDKRLYPWGNDSPCYRANINSCDGFIHTSPVGSFSPVGDSPYGIQDMVGNVWEWTTSYYTQSYAELATEEAGYRVVRGGSWYENNEYVSGRLKTKEDTQQHGTIGFRCVVPLN